MSPDVAGIASMTDKAPRRWQFAPRFIFSPESSFMHHGFTLLFVGSALLACGLAASAQTASSPADAGNAAAAPAAEPMVCVDQGSGGNSRLGTRKVCHTQKEW